MVTLFPGLVGIHKLADYCASKFGAVGFAESLMAELSVMGKDGVKSTLVCPYFISTGMFDGNFIDRKMSHLKRFYFVERFRPTSNDCFFFLN